MLVSQAVELAKPNKAVFELLVERMKEASRAREGTTPITSAHSIVFVDDKPANIEAACAVGIKGIHWKREDSTLAELIAKLRGIGVQIPE